jgi:hypothetical protein
MFLFPAFIVLGAPEGLMFALLAILLIGGYLLLRAMLTNSLPDVSFPLIGNLRNLAAKAFDAFVSGVESAWEVWGDAAGWLIAAPAAFVQHVVSGAIDVGENIAWKIEQVIRVDLPGFLSTALQFAQSVESTVQAAIVNALSAAYSFTQEVENAVEADLHVAEATLAGAISTAENAATDLFNELSRDVTNAIQVALSDAYTFTTEVERTVEGDIAALAATAEAAVHEAETLATALAGQALATAEAYAVNAAATAADDATEALNLAAHVSVGAVWQGIITDVQDVITTADQDFADVVTDLQSIATSVPIDIAGAIAATAAITAPLLKLAKDCTIPNCRNLSGLGQLLADLFSDATDVALAALIVEMVDSPTQAAQDISDVLGPVASGVIDGARSLVGV